MKAVGPLKKAGEGRLPGGAPIGLKPGDKDYKVDLSEAAKAPQAPATAPAAPPAPTVSTVSVPVPSLPSLPDLPTPSLESTAKDVARDEAAETAKKALEVKEKIAPGSVKKPAIIFVTGWQYMSSPSKSEGSYAGVGRMAEAIPGARLYGWDQKDAILEHVARTHKDFPVILVGHSLGGDTVKEVSDALDSLEHGFRKVDLLVTLDAVGFGNDIIPQNVAKHLNVFGENDFFLNDGPHVARRHEMTKVENILSPLDHTELDDAKDIQFEIVQAIESVTAKIK